MLSTLQQITTFICMSALAVLHSTGTVVAEVQQICAPVDLRVEYAQNPIGLDTIRPRFSFSLCHRQRGQRQTSYHIVVMGPANAVVWDSGAVKSNRSTNIPFAGDTLHPDTEYAWQVQWTDTDGATSPMSSSEEGRFSTGLLTRSDWADAQWISVRNPGAHTILRKRFTLSSHVRRITAYVVGLGYYKLWVDGTQVSQHELGAFTTYSERVLYDTHDCTAAVHRSRRGSGPSEHAVIVELGPGWYAQQSVHAGEPSALLRVAIHYVNNTVQNVVSDASWEGTAGPVVRADIYDGETFDERKRVSFLEASAWDAVVPALPPSDHVRISSHAVMPPIGVRATYSPCDMWEPSPGVYVFDFCQNMAGFVTLRIPEGLTAGLSGQNVSMLHAEAIHGPKGPIFHHYSRYTREINAYVFDGRGRAVDYTPKFVYAGFRYVQVEGYPGVPSFSTLTARFLNTLYDLIGDVSFSDPNLNAVQRITRAAAMSNFQSIPTDCPQRERRGWLGDAQLSSLTNAYNFGMAGAYTNFMNLIDDARDPATGATQDCVPWYGHGHQPADPAWGSAYTFLADLVAEFYDDDAIFGAHYDGIRAHLESLRALATPDGLLPFSWWGDWCPPSGCRPGPGHTNSALVSTFEYVLQLRMVARYAAVLGKRADAALYGALAANSSAAFVAHFFDADHNVFREPGRPRGSEELTLQTCISLASTLGVIPKARAVKVFDNLVADIAAKGGHLDAGIVGVKELLPALTRGGRVDVALQVAQTPTAPGWVYMVLQGATTLWETWTGSRYAPVASWNHIMFGSQSAWYFSDLAGIAMEPGSRGWQRLRLAPQIWASAATPPRSVCANLSFIDASTKTIRGRAAAAWTCGDHGEGGGTCSAVQEHATARLSCGPGTRISKVLFASFGTPVGTCERANFAIEKSCHANNSLAAVEAICAGKTSCAVPATTRFFNGDPCVGRPKRLAIHVQCSGKRVGPQLRFTYDVTVPVGSTATVVLPTFGVDPSNDSVEVTEGGSVVWSKGTFVGPSAAPSGVEAASAAGDGSADGRVEVVVGGGSYRFRMSS